jgi:predicted ABC-type transport system involved in lysophospholipase L1 biosynthesis ATPase subunit
VDKRVSFAIDEHETVAGWARAARQERHALSIMRLVPTATVGSGQQRLNGRELTSLDEEAMRKVRATSVTMIFQEPMISLNPVLTICFQVAGPFATTGTVDDRRRHRGLRLSISSASRTRAARFHENPHTFSGGMPGVMIAMALACQPDLLIADEPTTALDVTSGADPLAHQELQREVGRPSSSSPTTWGGGRYADRVVVSGAAKGGEPRSRDLRRPEHPLHGGCSRRAQARQHEGEPAPSRFSRGSATARRTPERDVSPGQLPDRTREAALAGERAHHTLCDSGGSSA